MNENEAQKIIDIDKLAKKLNADEISWSNFYIQTLSKIKASKLLGKSDGYAGSYGCEMYQRPQVFEYVNAVLNQLTTGPNENINFLRSIRDTDLNDYLTERKYLTSDTVKITLAEYIQRIEVDLNIENEYFLDYADTKSEQIDCLQKINYLKKQIAKCKIELRNNPGAYRYVQGPEYLATEMVLDLVKIHADKEHGKIKSIKHTKDGVQIEMYSAADAAETLARIDGSLDKSKLPPVTFDFNNAEVVFK